MLLYIMLYIVLFTYYLFVILYITEIVFYVVQFSSNILYECTQKPDIIQQLIVSLLAFCLLVNITTIMTLVIQFLTLRCCQHSHELAFLLMSAL